jgi:hypothetical protein
MRWAWHEKHGVVKGPIVRVSDTLTATQVEAEARAQHQREWSYQHANGQRPLYQPTRECARPDCEVQRSQNEMIWIPSSPSMGGSFWVCPQHYEAPDSKTIDTIISMKRYESS